MFERSYVYDIESYPNFFSLGLVHVDTGTRWIYEISDWRNDAVALVSMIDRLIDALCEMVGFNNEFYDYPLLHHIVTMFNARGYITPFEIYEKSKAIIDAPRSDWTHSVPHWKRMIPQVDLFKIMHFDNFARATSLKALQVAMCSRTVEDLPIKHGTIVTREEADILIRYMCHDCSETLKFLHWVADGVAFRRQLVETLGPAAMNYNDTKIGKQTFIKELEDAGVQCFEKIDGRKKPIQTRRLLGINVAEKLLPVQFQTEELQRIWQFFHGSVIPADETKGFFTNLTATVGDLDLHFGSGGLHASVDRLRFRENDEYEIIDIDVESYYPSLAISNRWYPEHLGDRFCDIYVDLKKRRVSYPKGSPENQALKLALNGVYGDSNNEHSCFYDPAYTMAITINGQLLLAWLTEALSTVDGLKVIQVNTDGVTVYVKRTQRPLVQSICDDWEGRTGLKLEYVNYRLMAVRDVNNYLAVDVDGGVKRKNAYQTEPPHKRKPLGWHQDLSSLVIPKAASAALIDGTDPTEFVYGHTDAFDFMRRLKVQRNHRAEIGDRETQRIGRYFIALHGDELFKVMPPLAGKTEERRNAIDKGWRVQICNNVADFDWHNLNRRFYVNEAKKLIDCIEDYTATP